MLIEIQVLACDRHKNVAGVKSFVFTNIYVSPSNEGRHIVLV